MNDYQYTIDRSDRKKPVNSEWMEMANGENLEKSVD